MTTQALRGAAVWAFLQSAGIGMLQFASGVLLARLLEPADFGAFIAVSAFSVLFIAQIKFGLPEALIQREALTPAHISGVFWTMQGLAIIATVIFLPAATWLQPFYGDERFEQIAIILGATFLVVPYVAIGSTLLKREFEFKRLTRIRIFSLLVSIAVTIPLAFSGAGPVSLAVGGLTAALTNAVALARVRSWGLLHYPGDIRGLLAYAWRTNLALTQQTAAERVDNMLIGSLLGTAALGIYNRAFSLARLPLDQFGESVRELIFSGFSRCQTDTAATVHLHYKLLAAITTITFPFLLLFLLIAEDFIRILYGEKWLPAALPLQVMILGVFASTIALSLHSLCAANNLLSRLAWLGFAQLVSTIVVVLVTARFGLIAVAIGIALRDIGLLFLLQRMVARSHLAIGWSGLLHALAPATIATGVAAAAALAFTRFVPWQSSDSPLVSAGAHAILAAAGILAGYTLTLLTLHRIWGNHAPLAATLGFISGLWSGMAHRLAPSGRYSQSAPG